MNLWNKEELMKDVLELLVKMEFWLFKHPEFLKESYMPPSIFNVEPWELNATKQLEAAIDNPEDHTYLRDANDSGPEYPEDHNYDYDYDHAQQ